MSIDKKFCILPFISGFVGTQKDFRLCCEFEESIPGDDFAKIWNGPAYRSYRKSFLKGEIPEACSSCINDEKAGIESYRQTYLRNYPADVKHYTTTKQLDAPAPRIFDIRFSNYCNLECVMCGPYSSSAIDKRITEYKDKKSLSTIYANHTFSNKSHKTTLEFLYENIHELQELVLAGGEPFLMPEVKALLEYCVEKDAAKNISLRITTNATTYRSKWFKDFLLKFKRIDLLCSVDATGEVLEYVRFPSKWSVIEKNLVSFNKLQKEHSNFIFRIEMCLHALNFKNFPTLINFSLDNDIWINASLVYYISGESKVINYDVLDAEYRKSIIDQIDTDRLFITESNIHRKLLNTLSLTPQKQLTAEEQQDVNALIVYWDSHKKVKFDELYPELNFLRNNIG